MQLLHKFKTNTTKDRTAALEKDIDKLKTLEAGISEKMQKAEEEKIDLEA